MRRCEAQSNMGLFGSLRRPAEKSGPIAATVDDSGATNIEADALPPETNSTKNERAERPTARRQIYAVRVRDNFKGEILTLQAELQLERQKRNCRSKKVTDGEIMEMMLDSFKAARRDGATSGNAVPVADDVWLGVHELARGLDCSPAEVVERLVVEKIAELRLLPRTTSQN